MRRFLLTFVGALLAFMAFAQVTPLRTAPANGATLSSLRSVWLYYDAEEVQDMFVDEAMRNARFPVYNSEGKQVARAYVFNYQAPIAILSIYPGLYAADTYTIDLPEGLLWLYDNTVAENKQLSEPFHFTFTIDGTEQRPTFEVATEPALGSEVDYLSTIKMTVPGYDFYGRQFYETGLISITDDATGSEVCKADIDVGLGAEGATSWFTIQPRQLINTAGHYTVNIPDSLLMVSKTGEGMYSTGDFDILPATSLHYTVLGAETTPCRFDAPVGQSAVEQFDIAFPTHSTVAYVEPDIYHSYVVYDERGNFASYVRGVYDSYDKAPGIDFDGNTLHCPLYANIHKPGTYTFSIPAGEFVFEDGTTNTDLFFSFTVEAPKPVTVHAKPADGSAIAMLSTLDLTFEGYDMPRLTDQYTGFDVTDEQGLYIQDESGKDLYFIYDLYRGDTARLRLSDGKYNAYFRKGGTYTVSIPAGTFLLNAERTQVNPDLTLTFTIVPETTPHTYTTWGHYTGEYSSDLDGLNTGYNANNVALRIPGEAPFVGKRIVGVRVPLGMIVSAAEVNSWIATDLTLPMHYAAYMPTGFPSEGYNTILFEEPYRVPDTGCYVGYEVFFSTLIEDYSFPVIYDSHQKVEGGMYLQYGTQEWSEQGSDLGISAMQVIFEDFDLSDSYATFGTVEHQVTVAGTPQTWAFPITITSAEPVTTIDYTITVDGESHNATAAVNIPAGTDQKGSVTVPFTAPEDALREYSVVLTVNSINGHANGLTTPTTSRFVNVSREVQRRSVVEELTGTGCGNCPRGFIGMQHLREVYGDRFIGMAIHRYNADDPMVCDYIDSSVLGLTGAPSANIDRKFPCDPYLGHDSHQHSCLIVDDFAPYVQIPALASVGFSTAWGDAQHTSVVISAETEALTDDTYDIVYAVVADGLTGSSMAWKQHNYYSSDDPSEWPEDLWLFCRNGDLGLASFSWAYDDVVVASSYDENCQSVATPLGFLAAGEVASSSFTLNLPTSGMLSKALQMTDDIYAVVLVLNSRGEVAQAEKVKVGTQSEGVDTVLAPVPAAAPQYDLSGRPAMAAPHGAVVVSRDRKVLR